MSTSRLILRPVVRMRSQIRLASTKPTHVYPDGDLGGPGGQQPPPQAPGGPEAVKRNWYEYHSSTKLKLTLLGCLSLQQLVY